MTTERVHGLGRRTYDEAEIRRLCAPISQGGEGLSQAVAAERVGCAQTTVTLALHPEYRRRWYVPARQRAYRRLTTEELLTRSEYHYSQVERHQQSLDDVERELARRRTGSRP